MIRSFALAAAAALLASSAQAATIVVNQTLDISGACFCDDTYVTNGFSGGVNADVAVGDTLDITYDFLGDQQLRLTFVSEAFPFIFKTNGSNQSPATVTGVLSFLGLNGDAVFSTAVKTQTVGSNGVGGLFLSADFAALVGPLDIAGVRWVGSVDAYDGVLTTRNFDAPSLSLSGGIENLAAVPEPATWAMMIMGFSLAGAGLRARRLRLA